MDGRQSTRQVVKSPGPLRFGAPIVNLEFDPTVEDALGPGICGELSLLARRASALQELVEDAATTEIVTPLLTPAQGRAFLKENGADAQEGWLVVSTEAGRLICIDQATPVGMGKGVEGIFYPELFSRLVAWWLAHVWRCTDFFEASLKSLSEWRIPTAAVTCRALLEDAGALVQETRSLTSAWKELKGIPGDPELRAERARATLGPILSDAGFRTRLPQAKESQKATNVLTLIKGLARAAKDDRICSWYDWLSDASHPSFAARISQSSLPMRHNSGAVILRFHSRTPSSLAQVAPNGEISASNQEPLANEVAGNVASALLVGGTIAVSVLEQSLLLVDDFGLTTEAALLNERHIWRALRPVRGSRACPCGRGKWAACGHVWGRPAPELVVPGTKGITHARGVKLRDD